MSLGQTVEAKTEHLQNSKIRNGKHNSMLNVRDPVEDTDSQEGGRVEFEKYR